MGVRAESNVGNDVGEAEADRDFVRRVTNLPRRTRLRPESEPGEREERHG